MAHPELSFQDGHREYSPQVLSGLTRVDHQDRFTNLSQLHVTARTSAPAQSLTARRHMTSRPVALPHHDASKFLVGEPLVTTQPRRAELSKTQGCFLRGFYSRRKTPKHRGSKYPRCPIFNQKEITSYRFGVETQNGIRVGSNQYENSRIRNFGAKSIRFVSRFTENIININAFIRHYTFIHIRHTSITFTEQKTIYL